MKLEIYKHVAGVTTHANPCGVVTTWVVSANTSLVTYFDFLEYLFLFMASLCNRAGHYIFVLWFLLSSSSFFFFPHLFSAVADWMSTILPHMVWRSVNLECSSEM